MRISKFPCFTRQKKLAAKKKRIKSGLPGQILVKVATKGNWDEKFIKKVAYLGAIDKMQILLNESIFIG
jgi:hypothetical protein